MIISVKGRLNAMLISAEAERKAIRAYNMRKLKKFYVKRKNLKTRLVKVIYALVVILAVLIVEYSGITRGVL